MRKILKVRFQQILSLFVLCILCVAMIAGGYIPAPLAYADTVIGDVQMDGSNVMDDLQNSTVDGVKFDIADYAFDESEQTQVFMFAEYCYSFYSNRQSNYGLYVYVWNPQGLKFKTNSILNTISIRAGDNDGNGYTKYTLLYLNQCEITDYEGLFLKFKVMLSGEQKEQIFGNLASDKRVYSIGEIELLVAGDTNATAITVSTEYIFSGFAKGCGSNINADSTLICSEEQTDTLTLDVHSTVYRTGVSNGKNLYTEDSLHSVYFAVPNEFIETFGELSAVHATWLNAVLAPALVTGNAEAREAISAYLGKSVGTNDENLTYAYLGVTDKEYYSLGQGVYGYNYYADYAYNMIDGYFGSSSIWNLSSNNVKEVANRIETLYMQFFSGSGENSADDYTVSSQQLQNAMLTASEDNGGTLVNGKYSRVLFSSVDEDFTEVNVKNSDTFSLAEAVVSDDWWRELFGFSQEIISTAFNDIQAIQPIDSSDITYESETDCKNLYISEADYDDFIEFYDANKENCTVYLFRYQVSDYISQEATLFEGSGTTWDEVDTNAFFFQETVNLDFDIIDVTFSNGEKDTVIPVVSSPIDVIPDATPPLVTTDDSDLSWWKIVLAVLALIVLLVILMPILPYIVQFVVWFILLPFRAIAAIFKGISKAAKKKPKDTANSPPKVQAPQPKAVYKTAKKATGKNAPAKANKDRK